MTIKPEHFEAVCAVLGVDPATTTSVNITPEWVRIVHSDRAPTSQAVVADEPAEPKQSGEES